MKLFTFVIYFACFCIINAKITHEKGREILVKSLTECKTKENGSEDELKRLLAMQYPETLEGRCMIACSLEDFAIYTDGNFSRGTFLYIVNMIVEKDEKLLKFAEELADKCGVSNGDRCEQAFTFAKCIHSGVKETLNLDIF